MGNAEPFAEILELARKAEAARLALPCTGPMEAAGTDAAGLEACAKAGAAASCAWASAGAPRAAAALVCPRARAIEALRATGARLELAGVPEREAGIVLAAIRLDAPRPLVLTRPLRAVAPLVHACRLDRLRTGSPPALMVLAGPPGVGKTVAAAWALSQLGGRYVTAYQLRPGIDLDALRRCRLLVIDQLGREARGASDYSLALIEELLDCRYAAHSPVIACSNLNRTDFEARYQGVIADRLAGGGAYVVTTGASMRSRA